MTEIEEYFIFKARKGLRENLKKIDYEVDEQVYKDRLEYEIKVILEMGYPAYFLITADFIRWAKANKISVGPGRGSGAGSLCCWAMGITSRVLDPIKYDLFFERFLNPGRLGPPDINTTELSLKEFKKSILPSFDTDIELS